MGSSQAGSGLRAMIHYLLKTKGHHKGHHMTHALVLMWLTTKQELTTCQSSLWHHRWFWGTLSAHDLCTLMSVSYPARLEGWPAMANLHFLSLCEIVHAVWHLRSSRHAQCAFSFWQLWQAPAAFLISTVGSGKKTGGCLVFALPKYSGSLGCPANSLAPFPGLNMQKCSRSWAARQGQGPLDQNFLLGCQKFWTLAGHHRTELVVWLQPWDWEFYACFQQYKWRALWLFSLQPTELLHPGWFFSAAWSWDQICQSGKAAGGGLSPLADAPSLSSLFALRTQGGWQILYLPVNSEFTSVPVSVAHLSIPHCYRTVFEKC